MAVESEVVSVGTTPVALHDEQPRISIGLYVPAGGSTIYLGPAGVTSATGFPLAAEEKASFELEKGDRMYAVTASGSQNVNVLRVNA